MDKFCITNNQQQQQNIHRIRLNKCGKQRWRTQFTVIKQHETNTQKKGNWKEEENKEEEEEPKEYLYMYKEKE